MFSAVSRTTVSTESVEEAGESAPKFEDSSKLGLVPQGKLESPGGSSVDGLLSSVVMDGDGPDCSSVFGK